MTADYNGWNDAPEAEREAMAEYTQQEFEREGLAQAEAGAVRRWIAARSIAL